MLIGSGVFFFNISSGICVSNIEFFYVFFIGSMDVSGFLDKGEIE